MKKYVTFTLLFGLCSVFNVYSKDAPQYRIIPECKGNVLEQAKTTFRACLEAALTTPFGGNDKAFNKNCGQASAELEKLKEALPGSCFFCRPIHSK